MERHIILAFLTQTSEVSYDTFRMREMWRLQQYLLDHQNLLVVFQSIFQPMKLSRTAFGLFCWRVGFAFAPSFLASKANIKNIYLLVYLTNSLEARMDNCMDGWIEIILG